MNRQLVFLTVMAFNESRSAFVESMAREWRFAAYRCLVRGFWGDGK